MTEQEKRELMRWLNKKMTESYIVRATSEAAVYNEVYCHVEKIIADPRVMTLEEVLALDNDTPIYIQDKLGESGWDIYRGIENDITHDVITGAKWAEGDYWDSRKYGDTWCCWTSRPTEEQMEAVKWG